MADVSGVVVVEMALGPEIALRGANCEEPGTTAAISSDDRRDTLPERCASLMRLSTGKTFGFEVANRFATNSLECIAAYPTVRQE